jgi:integrase
MVLRSLLRYLSREGHLPSGWDAALPAIATRKHISLPRGLSQEQVRALWSASEGRKLRNLRDRALLLVFLRLGLRAEEVANISLADIDRSSGCLKIRSAKTYRERVLPLPQDVGEAMASYLEVWRRRPTHVFEPRRPPFTEQRRRKGARKGCSDRQTVPAIPGERSLAGVLGIALTTTKGGAFKMRPAFCISPDPAPSRTSSPLPTSPRISCLTSAGAAKPA